MHLLDPRFALDREEALRFAAARGFGLFATFDGARPVGSHLPFIIRITGTDTIVEFHVAQANPLATMAEGRNYMLVVTGVDAYVCNDWYATKDQVSTWLYEAVHITGPARRRPSAANSSHADDLLRTCEQRLSPKPPWRLDQMDPSKRVAMLRAIVTIELTVEAVEGQRKLNQHKSDGDHVAVVRALSGGASAAGREIAERMKRHRQHLDYDQRAEGEQEWCGPRTEIV